MGGNEDSFGRFEEYLRLHQEKARRFVHAKLWAALRRRLDTDDVLQEAYSEAARLFRERRELSSMDKRRFFPWLAKVIDHRIKNLVRRFVEAERRSVRKERPTPRNWEHSSLPGHSKTPSEIMVEGERFEEVQTALRTLSPKEREVVDLVYLKGMRVSEAARRLRKTPGATSVLLHRSLKKLGNVLRPGRN